MLSAADVERRLPVWMAMSEIFLDTELDTADFARISNALRTAGYDSAELKDIFFQEVVPVLGHNLLSAVGEWAGWNSEDLRRLLLPRLQRKRRVRSRNWLFCLALGRHFFVNEWKKIDPRTSVASLNSPHTDDS
jgi:hypothetical protein